MAELRATPYANPLTGLSNDAIQGLLAFMQDKKRTQQLQGLGNLLESTGIPKTVERAAYADSPRGLLDALTNVNRANVPFLKPETAEVAMTLAPIAAPVNRALMQATKGLPVGASVKLININKGIYKPDLTMEEMLKVRDIPTVERVQQSLGLVGKKQFEKMVDAQFKKYKPSSPEQEAMLVESVTLEILGKAQRSPYPQEEALLLAQQRAALPKEQYGLGLPADNTPEMRAAAMNMEKRGFSETEGKNIEEGLLSFDTRRVGAAASDEQTPYAMFIKPSGKGIGIAKNQPAQMPLYVKSNQTDENILRSFGDRAELQQYLNQFPEIREATKAVRDLDNQMANYMEELSKKADALDAQGKTAEADKILNSMNFDSPLMKEFDARTNELAAISKQKITELFNQQQVGTVGLRNDQGAFGRNTITEMVLNPNENVRSAFAAFDPFRRTAAIAAATGVAAPDLMAKEIDYSLIPAEKRRQILSLLD